MCQPIHQSSISQHRNHPLCPGLCSLKDAKKVNVPDFEDLLFTKYRKVNTKQSTVSTKFLLGHQRPSRLWLMYLSQLHFFPLAHHCFLVTLFSPFFFFFLMLSSSLLPLRASPPFLLPEIFSPSVHHITSFSSWFPFQCHLHRDSFPIT